MKTSIKKSISLVLVISMFLTCFAAFPNSLNLNTAYAATFASDLFISEYIEGSGYNKAIEIYNGTSESVDLSNYSLELYSNGATTTNAKVTLSSVLESGDVFVVSYEPTATNLVDEEILNVADLQNRNVINFNGDDAVVLKNNENIIDVIGQVGVDPGTAWASSDSSVSTVNKTLVRNSRITVGDTDPSNAFDPSEEWIAYPQDIFSYLGSHTMDGFESGGGNTPIALSVTHNAITSASKNTDIDVNFTVIDDDEVTAEVYYKASSFPESETTSISAIKGSGISYYATIPATDVTENIDYYILVSNDNSESVRIPELGYNIINVNEEETIDISDAKTKPVGTEVRVKGIVTYSTQPRTIFMQDASGGICIDSGSGSINISDNVGKEIVIKGVITVYGGMVQVKPASASEITVINENPAMPEPLLLTIYELMNTDRAQEGKLIKIENAQIKTIGGTETGTYNHIITQGGVDTTLRAKALSGKNVGDFITITGVAGYYNNPQIQANVIDIVDGAAPSVDMVTALPTSGSTLPIGGNVTLSTTTEGATISYTINGSAEQTIDSNTGTVTIKEFSQEGNQAVITAKAIKDGSSTPEAIFKYTQAKTQMVRASLEGAIEKNTQVILSAAEKAAIRYVVTSKAGLPEEVINPESTYLEPISINMENLPIKITAYAVEAGYLNSDSATFSYYLASNEPYKNYFGQLHSHTAENSDGSGTLAEAYTYARDIAKLDFFAVTDHSNAFDNAPSGDKAGTYNLGDYNKNNIKWQNGQNAAAAAHTDSFISVYGYEMTWSGGPGHMNTFATNGFVSRNNTELNNKSNDAGLRAYYQLLKETPNSISQFNHPGKTFGNFNDFAYLDPIADARITLVEVGNGEGDIDSGAYFPSYEEYTKALDKGWHLAPTNNQDNHKGRWGDSNTARTVIYTNDLSVEGLYDALRDMRVYATEDNNIDIVYTLNDDMLGTIVDSVPEMAEFSISITDPDSSDKIKTVSVISNGGKSVFSEDFDSQNAIFKETIANPTAGYYYVKVVQEDGDIAVTAPVWLGSAPKIGIDSVEHDKMMPATNEALTLTTKIFNNEAEAAKIKSIKYDIKGGSTIGTYEPNADIAGNGGMYTHSHSHTFTQPGIFTLTVTVVLSQNGNDVTYSKDLEVNVRDSEKLIYIGIDASHDNEYVAGNYKDSMTNFGKLAAKYNVRTVELKTSEELLAALENPKYQMMIFTVPSRRNGTVGRIPFKSYSDDEIQAVSNFAKSGKTVIVTGWGDYYENYSNLKADPNFTADQHMAAQQNKLLSAIGSKLRLADDEAKDNTLNGGQSQRLYLTDYNNFADPFTEGVVSEQVYSQYGGSTIFAIDENGNAINTLPSNIYPTISGHETTYSSDDDKDGNAVPPKYNSRFVLMANETITHDDGTKSTVVAAGGAFMSNFEIQVELENAGTLPYSNYNILENIILTLRNVSTIADVHKMQVGTEVIIEGIATTDVFNGSDSNKGFFDCIYIQDSTGGINLFPVADGVKAGQRIRVLGSVGEYQGEKQLQVEKVSVLDSEIRPVAPIEVTPQKAMSSECTGSLVKFKGSVTEIIKDNDGVVGQLMVSGARVYINGYITKGVSLANIKVGDTVEVTGISSIGENMSSTTEFLPRIRVRDRAEIVVENSPYITANNNEICSTIDVKVQILGDTAASDISQETIEGVLNSATEMAKNRGTEITVEFKVNDIDDATEVVINMPISSISSLADNADNIAVTTPIGNINFDKKAFGYIAENAVGDIQITASIVDKNTLSDSMQKIIGDKAIYSFSVSDGDKEFSSYKNGKISISVPYMKSENEKANKIIIYNLDKNGKHDIIKNSKYDENRGMVSFVTNYLTSYFISYK